MVRARSNALFIVGTRPEAIKMLPLIKAFEHASRARPVIVSTGQHAQMVAEVLALGGITPNVTFPSPVPGRSLNELFTHVLLSFDRFFRSTYGEPVGPGLASDQPEDYPGACFVHGDTTSAAAGALAAFHLGVPVIHVEAGLRTSDTLSPFPEELNRQLISRIAAWHLAPTSQNMANLLREGIPAERIYVSGNTGIDALHFAASLDQPYQDPQLEDLEHPDGPRLVIVTAHRRENWGKPLAHIGTAVRTLATMHSDVRFVLPLHPNPAVRAVLRGELEGLANVSLVEPMGYAAFARLLKRAYVVLTDSGGIQEEAPSLGTPVLVLRKSTERQEGVDAGTLDLIGTRVEAIVAATDRLLADPEEYRRRRARVNPYGDGQASERIRAATEHLLTGSQAPAPFGPSFDRHAVLRAAGSADGADALLGLYRDDSTSAITTTDTSPLTSVGPMAANGDSQ